MTIHESREDHDWHCRPFAFMEQRGMSYAEAMGWLKAQWWGPASIVYRRHLRGDFDTTTGELRTGDPSVEEPLRD